MRGRAGRLNRIRAHHILQMERVSTQEYPKCQVVERKSKNSVVVGPTTPSAVFLATMWIAAATGRVPSKGEARFTFLSNYEYGIEAAASRRQATPVGATTATGVILGRGTKMSEGGICLFALANLAIGAQIDVELTDSRCGTPVRVSGIVRNRIVYLYGVGFVIDQQEDRQQIARLRHSVGGTTHLQSS
jgi:hypothetical protein